MIRVGIVGGTGYTGIELLRILIQHPGVEIAVITSRGDAGVLVSDMFPSLRNRLSLRFKDPAKADLEKCGLVFCNAEWHRNATGSQAFRYWRKSN